MMNLMDDEERIRLMIGKILGQGALSALSISTHMIWPAEAVALLYIFARKYHKEKRNIAGFSRDELEEDVIWADIQAKKLRKEKKNIEQRIERLKKKNDEDAESALRVATYELKSVDRRIRSFIGRREFDELLLIMLEHRQALEKAGVWKEMDVPNEFVKKLDKEQKRIEKAEINFSEFSGYMRVKMDEIIE